jgi:predicted nucleic acid-binding protein
MSCEQTLLYIDEVGNRLKTIALDCEEYYSVISDAAAEGIVGGMVYDALIARCALKAGAETIFTWNIDHFRRVGPEVAKRVRTP